MNRQPRYVIKDREQSPLAESFRALCSCIQDEAALGKIQTVLFASASADEGGTMAAVNAAAGLAYAGKRVVLLEGNLRCPILHDGFGLPNVGLTNLIDGEISQEQTLQDTWIPNLRVVTSGPLPIGPIAALSNQQTRGLLEYLRGQADYVLITSAPLLVKQSHVMSDACVLASRVDGVVLVIEDRKVKAKTAQKVVELLNGARANIIGAVLNNVAGFNEIIYHAELK